VACCKQQKTRTRQRTSGRTTIVCDPIPLARSLPHALRSAQRSRRQWRSLSVCRHIGSSSCTLTVSTGRSGGGPMRRRACVRSPAPQAVGSASRRARLAPRA
jgi:hypothetical protein